MTRVQATAEIFFTAFKALPKKEQDVFLSKLFSDMQAYIQERKARYGGKV